MYIYENRSHMEDRALLENDKVTYALLFNVLGEPVKKVITDHKRIIIAHTAAVFPTWIWAPDDVSNGELDIIYQTIKKEFSPIKDYRFNTKYEIAMYLIDRFRKDDQIEMNISVNIAAYECHKAKEPLKAVDGQLEVLGVDDVDLASKLIREASIAIGDRVISEEESVQAAKEQLESKCLYIWRNKAGKAVAFCGLGADEHYTKFSQVYTVPEERGKSYAGRMIYELCVEIIGKGQTPMLYADADYVSSNRCYQNVGFELKGRLVTIQ